MNIGGRPRWPLRDVAAIGCAIRIETRHSPILQGLRGDQGRGSAKSKNQKYQARCQEVLHSLTQRVSQHAPNANVRRMIK